MLTPRGITVALAGVGMWVAARILGSPGLETVAIGLLLLPFIAGAVRPLGTRTIQVQRHLSEPRVAPGTRVTVRLDVDARRPAPSPRSCCSRTGCRPPSAGPRAWSWRGRRGRSSGCPTRSSRTPAAAT